MLEFLYLIFIAPIEVCMGAVFEACHALTGSYGLSLIGVSIVVSTAVLPFYNKVETWQEAERDIKMRMAPREAMIRRAFKGQERFAMLQTLYRQSGYSPLMSLRSSLGVMLQIPFFIAAYQLISNMQILNGQSFGIIRNLGAPDALLTIGGMSINVLPILMTAVNLLSAFIYTKGLSVRDKIQLYGIAGLFLVLLYNSPAALTFYWLMNNVYSLVKNLVEKDLMKRQGWLDFTRNLSEKRGLAGEWLKRKFEKAAALRIPLALVFACAGLLSVCCLAYGFMYGNRSDFVLSAILGAYFLLGMVFIFLGKKLPDRFRYLSLLSSLALLAFIWASAVILGRYGIIFKDLPKTILYLLIICVLYAGYLCLVKFWGKLAPAFWAQKKALGNLFYPAVALIAYLALVYAPFMVFSSDPLVFNLPVYDFASVRFGIFLAAMICFTVIGVLIRPIRWLFGSALAIMAFAALAFCFIVAPDVGTMDAFVFQRPEVLHRIINVVIDVSVFLFLAFLFAIIIYFKKIEILRPLLYTSLTLLLGMTFIHLKDANAAIARITKAADSAANTSEFPEYMRDFFTFSRYGKNVVVVMTDMFTGGNMNQLLERHPELREELDGFIWYEDVVTAGSLTVFGKPGILGGMEAHPLVINQDKSRSLEEKIAQAKGSFLRYLQDHNFTISIQDDEFLDPELLNNYLDKKKKSNLVVRNKWEHALEHWENKNYKITKLSSHQPFFNMIGLYNIVPIEYKSMIYDDGKWHQPMHINILGLQDMASRLGNLEIPIYLSHVENINKNSFIYCTSLLTHVPWNLDENGIPNEIFDWDNLRDLSKGGLSIGHLNTEFFTLKILVKWFDWMKEHGVYNNTMIIIVSDHGRGDSVELVKIWQGFPPIHPHGLLLVKEYDAEGELKIDRTTQMANWDVPQLIKNSLETDTISHQYPWHKERERLHVIGNWRRQAHPKNEYKFSRVFSIQGPLYKKESFKELKDYN